MDPGTALQIASIALQAADAAFTVGTKLYKFVQDVKRIEETANEFASETKALGTACYLVGTCVKTAFQEQEQKSNLEQQGDSEILFACLTQQLEDCNRSIDQLQAAISCAGQDKVNNSGCFMRAILQIKLNTKAGDVEIARNRIRSHTSSLQLILHSIAMYDFQH